MRPVAAAFVALAVLVTGVASYLAFLPDRSGRVSFWLLAGGPTVALAALASAWAHREDLLRDWLGPRWGDFTRGVVGAVFLVGAAWGVTRLLAPVGSSREIWLVTLYGQIGDPKALQAQAPAVAAALVVSVVAEEVLWRGMVTALLAERFGSRAAWVVSAALYALAYVPTMWSLRAGQGLAALDPVLPLAAFGAGLLWGAMSRAFGRLAPGILAHVLFDWAIVMMFPLWGPG